MRAIQSDTFDLIIASDALCYVGDLAPILQGAYRALHPSGLLAFTVETMAEALPGQFKLHRDTGRFSHSKEYVMAAARAAGLKEHLHQRAQLGKHARYGREGDLYVFHKIS